MYVIQNFKPKPSLPHARFEIMSITWFPQWFLLNACKVITQRHTNDRDGTF